MSKKKTGKSKTVEIEDSALLKSFGITNVEIVDLVTYCCDICGREASIYQDNVSSLPAGWSEWEGNTSHYRTCWEAHLCPNCTERASAFFGKGAKAV